MDEDPKQRARQEAWIQEALRRQAEAKKGPGTPSEAIVINPDDGRDIKIEDLIAAAEKQGTPESLAYAQQLRTSLQANIENKRTRQAARDAAKQAEGIRIVNAPPESEAPTVPEMRTVTDADLEDADPEIQIDLRGIPRSESPTIRDLKPPKNTEVQTDMPAMTVERMAEVAREAIAKKRAEDQAAIDEALRVAQEVADRGGKNQK